MDIIGRRFKEYESVFQYKLPTKSAVIIRVDGQAFHTFTKNCQRPFDVDLVNSMRYAADETRKRMMGCKLVYVASDEASFYLTDTDNLETQSWFGNNLSKIVSIAASTFTAHFNHIYTEGKEENYTNVGVSTATFDARAFVVPFDDVPNYFLWRQKDWTKNSLSMLCREYYSHNELIGKSQSEQHELLYKVDVNWNDLSSVFKNGTYILNDGTFRSNVLPIYEVIRYLIQ